MQCVILAGGLGTRMWPRAQVVPKTLLPVAGRPFADWQLQWLAHSGVTRVVYCIGYLGSQVRDFVADGSRWDLEVDYVDEGDELRGTAGALALAASRIRLDEQFLVLYGDSWLQVDPSAVLLACQASGLPALMTVFENNDRWDQSNVVVSDGLVTRYDKASNVRPPDMRWIDYGLSALSRDVVEEIDCEVGPRDLAPVLSALASAKQLAAYEVNRRFFEIGSPSGLEELERLLRRYPVRPSRTWSMGRPPFWTRNRV